MKYFKIDVHGESGYSFLVGTHYNETEDSIIDICADCGVFADPYDARYATAEEVEEGDSDYYYLKETLVILDAE